VSRTSIGHDLKGARRRHRNEFVFSTEFFVGFTAGLAVAVGVYLWQQQTINAIQVGVIGTTKAPSPSASVIEPETSEEADPDFDFPRVLPTREVVIVEKSSNTDAAPLPSSPILRPGAYVLHFGMFKDEARAEQLSVKLLRLGIRSEIQRLTVDNLEHYRVRLGPLSDLAELNRVRALLNRSDIETEVIRVGE